MTLRSLNWTPAAPRLNSKPLSDDDLGRMMALVRGADSVELKLTVLDEGRESAVAALGMDPLDAQIRQVYFFDTPDLVLEQNGLIEERTDKMVYSIDDRRFLVIGAVSGVHLFW